VEGDCVVGGDFDEQWKHVGVNLVALWKLTCPLDGTFVCQPNVGIGSSVGVVDGEVGFGCFWQFERWNWNVVGVHGFVVFFLLFLFVFVGVVAKARNIVRRVVRGEGRSGYCTQNSVVPRYPTRQLSFRSGLDFRNSSAFVRMAGLQRTSP